MGGYLDKHRNYPPGKGNGGFGLKFFKSLYLTGTVVKNMFDGHIEAYKVIKQANPEAQIGLAKIFHYLDPYHTSGWKKHRDKLVANFGNKMLHEAFLNYFKTGKFSWIGIIKDTNPEATKSLDFIGVNYYSHATVNGTKQQPRPEDILSEGDENKPGKPFYPEGLERACRDAATLKIPIMITEHDRKTQKVEEKEEDIKKTYYILLKLLKEGLPIIGYHNWASVGCYSWGSGFNNGYGIYHVDQKTQQRTFNPCYKFYVDIVKAWRKKQGLDK